MTQVLARQQDVISIVEAFSNSRASENLIKLCSAEFEGRRVGTVGHDRAQTWLLEQLQRISLRAEISIVPGATVRDLYAAPTLSRLTKDGDLIQFYRHRTEFSEHLRSADQPEPIQGLVQREMKSNLQGAWVMLGVSPRGDKFTQLAERLRDRSAIGILVPQHATSEGYLPKQLMSQVPVALPIISVRAEQLPEFEGSQVRASVPLRASVVEAGNVTVKLPGIDPSLEGAPLIVGAHFDAVGDDPGGHRIQGAGDNAAGVAVVLEVARVIADLPERPRRPIIFAGFDAEEVGAVGSRVFANSLKEQGQTPFMINLDGAARFQEAVWVEPSLGSEPLLRALDQAGRWLEIPLAVGNVSSDNRQFARIGFPSVGLALGSFGMHSPADTLEHIDHQAMSIAGHLLLAVIWQIAFRTA
jgi:aminopeptidase YwaD